MTYQPPFALDLYATMLHAGEKGISKGFDAIDAANLFAKIKVADLLQIRTEAKKVGKGHILKH